MFSNSEYSGKHLICDVRNARNQALLNDLEGTTQKMDDICNKHGFTILNKSFHKFEPQGFTILYLLSESHFSIHTYPERNYAAIDLYTCREYENDAAYDEIYDYWIEAFGADREKPTIIDRRF
jgi:S-adenosylmethionine decarboxylase